VTDKDSNEGRSSRAAIFAVAGAVVIIVAIGMSIWSARRESAPQAPPQAASQGEQAAPAKPAPGQEAPPAKTAEAKPAASAEATKPAPAPAAAEAGPSFDVVRIARDGRTVMAGRAAPGATVIVMDGDKEVGRTKADDHGEWILTPDQPLSPGSRELSLQADNPNGEKKAGDAPVVLVVPERQKVASDQNGGNEALAIKVKPGGGVQLLQVPTAKGGSGPVSIEVVNFNEKGHLSVAGRAVPNATIQVYIDNDSLGSAAADAKGAWSIAAEHPLADGSHTVRADQVDAGGKVVARAEISFTSGGGGPTSGTVTVATGNSLWRIARRAYGSGFDYIVIYRANRDQIRNPDLIYPGQVFKLPTKS
jgi:nucleoid-associated protein YgaU